MNTNLKVLLSAVGVAALLASPAFAKPQHARHHALTNVPADAQASTTYAPSDSHVVIVSPYSASTKSPAHDPSDSNFNPDFQLGGER